MEKEKSRRNIKQRGGLVTKAPHVDLAETGEGKRGTGDINATLVFLRDQRRPNTGNPKRWARNR